MLLRQNTKKHTAFVILFNIAKAKNQKTNKEYKKKQKNQSHPMEKTKKPRGNTKKTKKDQNSDTLWLDP